ncbi:hypothetical protein L5515_002768 [Caenorhabditis briggsae]|uniref:Uncharacterized protein n=1 Tax=Caenorhabditis briggsae TaxID=6238 RepID=A0AAE9E7D4_CAEBR|nr:hypothetical protein L5515_002768 [Caenorhabditis briggsae]
MRRPTTASSNQYRRIIPFNSSSLSSIPCSYLFQYYSFLILIILCSARGTVTEGGQPLTELLSSLDQPYPCGHVVEAEHFLSTAVALKFPRLIQLAHFFANHSKNFDPQLLDKSSFLPYPPFEVSFARRTHFYGLQLNCTGNNHRWLPRLVFVSHDPNNVNRKAYLTLQLDQFDVDMCSAVDCHTKVSFW